MPIALRKASLHLSAIVAFLILLFMQGYMVFAEEIGGTNGLGETLLMSPVGQSRYVIGMSGIADSDLEIVTMPPPTTGTAAVVGGSQAELNGAVTSMGVASSYFRFFEYWGLDGVVHTTTETTSTATGTYSDTVEGISTVGGFSYRAGVRVGTVYTYGSTATLTTSYTGADRILQIVPLIIWCAILVAIVYLFKSGYGKYKEGDNANGNLFWLLAIVAVLINALMFDLVLEAIAAILGG